jgi:hypothetical protein
MPEPNKGIRKRIHDWPGLFIEYYKKNRFDESYSIPMFSRDKDLDLNEVYREFKELRNKFNAATAQQLDLAAPRALEIARILMEEVQDPKIKADIVFKLLNLWVQKEKINLSINTTGAVNVGIAMFAKDDKDLAFKMLEGDKQ